MVNLEGLTGIPEPKSGQSTRVRNDRQRAADSAAAKGKATDGVSISSEAKAAQELSRLAQMTRAQDDIRVDKVDAARENIAKGAYKDPEVVAKVAEKLIKMLS